MVDDARACGTAEVPAEVVPVRPVLGDERVDRDRRQTMDLESLLVGEPAEAAGVAEGRRHQVARGVRETVEQEERVLAAEEHEVGLRLAEDAARALVDLLDVLESPRRPERLGHAPSVPRRS